MCKKICVNSNLQTETLSHRYRSRVSLVIVLFLGILGGLVSAQNVHARLGDKTLDDIILTDELYGNDCLFSGPRGRDYGSLPNGDIYQKSNLFPDAQATYWGAELRLPPGACMNIYGKYPYARYMSFTVANYSSDGSMIASLTENLADIHIVPDNGSQNPFIAKHNRMHQNRSYTVHVIAENPPANPSDREWNTLYIGESGACRLIYRVYMPDIGRDGSGDVGLPTVDAVLADWTHLTKEEVCEYLTDPGNQNPPKPGMTVAQWVGLINRPGNNPATAPAQNPAKWELYWNNKYSVAGQFYPPQIRATWDHTRVVAFGGNPHTYYLFTTINRQFGKVYMIRGKMPLYPNTYGGDTVQNRDGDKIMDPADVRYWSLMMNECPASGEGGDGLTDMQVPLDENGYYTIVVSRPEDRPANAYDEYGIAWMDWGYEGDGIPAPYNRPDSGYLIMRFMLESPEWLQGPSKITSPGQEAEVMGPYFPVGTYMTKEECEALGSF